MTGVYDDEEERFQSIFANSKKEDAIRNQYEFSVQRMGGPPLYSQRKGHPALIGHHSPFPVTHQVAERWLRHMQQALDGMTDIDADSKIKMMNFFRYIFSQFISLSLHFIFICIKCMTYCVHHLFAIQAHCIHYKKSGFMRRNYLRRHTCRLKKSLFATAENAVSKKQSICDGTICRLKKAEHLRRHYLPSQKMRVFATAENTVANTLIF
ncbi:hypothetical protein ACSBR2_037031 [Camellia fascicularis]